MSKASLRGDVSGRVMPEIPLGSGGYSKKPGLFWQ